MVIGNRPASTRCARVIVGHMGAALVILRSISVRINIVRTLKDARGWRSTASHSNRCRAERVILWALFGGVAGDSGRVLKVSSGRPSGKVKQKLGHGTLREEGCGAVG